MQTLSWPEQTRRAAVFPGWRNRQGLCLRGEECALIRLHPRRFQLQELGVGQMHAEPFARAEVLLGGSTEA